MKASEFAYWLQGMFELCDPKSLDEKQTDLIKRHLALVFIHDIDPKAGPHEVQAKLNEVHGKPQAAPPVALPSRPVMPPFYRC